MRDMAMAGFPVEEEPQCLPGFGQGGGNLLLHRYGDPPAMADVTVTSSVQSAVVENAAMTPCLLRKRRRKESGTSTEQFATNCGYSWCP